MLIDYDSVLIIFVLVYILIVVTKLIISKRRNQPEALNKRRLCHRTLFYVYLVIVIAITLFPVELPPMCIYNYQDLVNFDVLKIIKEPVSKATFVNVVGNILLFVPLCGLYNLCAFKKKMDFKRGIVASTIFSIGIETVQLIENITGLSSFYARVVDIDDVILNVLGGAIGCGIASVLIRRWRRKVGLDDE